MSAESTKAFATMLTSESYLPGALTLLKSIKKHHPHLPVYCLSTLSSSSKAHQLLESQFDKVIQVSPIIYERNRDNLGLLGRPELDMTLTKLHVFGIEGVDQLVFLDADTLVLHPIAPDLFTYVDEAVFAAAPDIGWPDCFNSGVFALRPHPTLYTSLLEYSEKNKSFDGGDQGLLNTFFSSWPKKDSVITSRLPFTFNVTPSPYYTYMPAFVHFAQDLKIAHFIGPAKPWKWNRTKEGKVLFQQGASEQTLDLVAHWWKIFDEFQVNKLLDGFVLDRDWSRYSAILNEKNHQFEEEPINVGPNPIETVRDELSNDLINYKIGWRSSELGPVKRSNSPTKSNRSKSRSPIRQPFTTTGAESKTGKSLVFSTSRPPSSKMISNRSSSPVRQKQVKSSSLENYEIQWNLDELKGASISSLPGHPFDFVGPSTSTSQNTEEVFKGERSISGGIAAVKRPTIKTDSFIITEHGQIIYK